jgi:hypothetical protein
MNDQEKLKFYSEQIIKVNEEINILLTIDNSNYRNFDHAMHLYKLKSLIKEKKSLYTIFINLYTSLKDKTR